MAEWSNALQQDSLSPEYLDLFLSGTLGAASMAEWSNALQQDSLSPLLNTWICSSQEHWGLPPWLSGLMHCSRTACLLS